MKEHRYSDARQEPDDEAFGNDVLARAAYFRDVLIGILERDLRTPVRALRAAVEPPMRNRHISPAQFKPVALQALRKVEGIAGRMDKVIGDLQDFARTRAGGAIPIHPVDADMRVIARGVIEDLEMSHPERRILFEWTGALEGCWDPARVGQALRNLLLNAVQYSPPETPISVVLADEGPQVSLSVNNRGECIPSDMLRELLEAPKQGLVPGSRLKDGGFGLGIYIVQAILAAHGGTLRAVSAEEKGTTFRMLLPRRAGDADAYSGSVSPSAAH